MKIHEKRLVETVVDRVCDVCNKSVMTDASGEQHEECGVLKADWGYGSKQDGDSYHLDLCVNCFKVALLALKEHRRSEIMFDEDQYLPDGEFGLK